MVDEKQPIPIKIKVWHVENETRWQEHVAQDLRNAGYLVVTTGTVAEARGMIPGAINDVSAAVLDNDMGDGQGGEIAELIKNSNLPIAIISFASRKMPWADIAVDKHTYDNLPENNELLKALAKLLQD